MSYSTKLTSVYDVPGNEEALQARYLVGLKCQMVLATVSAYLTFSVNPRQTSLKSSAALRAHSLYASGNPLLNDYGLPGMLLVSKLRDCDKKVAHDEVKFLFDSNLSRTAMFCYPHSAYSSPSADVQIFKRDIVNRYSGRIGYSLQADVACWPRRKFAGNRVKACSSLPRHCILTANGLMRMTTVIQTQMACNSPWMLPGRYINHIHREVGMAEALPGHV